MQIIRFKQIFSTAIITLCFLHCDKSTEPQPETPDGITDVHELLDAVNNGKPGDRVYIGEGTFIVTRSLQPKPGMAIEGAGRDKTILQADDAWSAGDADLPDNPVDHNSINRNVYMFDLGDKTENVRISDMTLKGPRLHGAIYGNDCDRLHLYNLRLEGFRWSGIRTFRMSGAKIHDNVLVDAGGEKTHAGGALFLTWVSHSEFYNNHIYKTENHPFNFFGFKGRQAKHCRFHHNTVEVGFSLELPFENDENVEIDHNMFTGPISIPKHSGGNVPAGGHTFHIHHNWLKRSYALEWPRNGAKVDHNFFDFDVTDDGGNLISNFARSEAPGPTYFHNNVIYNPGRGLYWGEGVYNRFYFYNNHVIAGKTVTPRKDGLFGFNKNSDFSSIEIRDNIVECKDLERPLVRNHESYGAVIKNNTLTGISDTAFYPNPDTGEPRGPIEPLYFKCGVNEEFTVDFRGR